MEKKTITFSANEQKLIKTGGIDCYASNTVAYIEAHFDLGENWDGYDSVRAVWWNDYNKTVSTVLDSDGACIVPYEVLTRKSAVKVNLVGSIADGDVLTDRLTTCPVIALTIKCNAKTDGDNTQPITPSEYEQFVAEVKADADRAEAGAESAEASAQSASESATASANSASDSAQSATASAQSAQNASESAQSAENAKDDAEDARDEILGMRATAETLEAGSDATASYSDGVLTLGIPRGDKGDKGDIGETGATPNLTIGTVETLAPTEDATATITGTAENPVLNLGIPKGDTGEVSQAELDSAVSDLKSEISEFIQNDIQWGRYGIDGSSGVTDVANVSNNKYRLCTMEMVEVDSVSVTGAGVVNIFLYNSAYSYLGNSGGWSTGKTKDQLLTLQPTAKYMRVLFKRNDGTETALTDVTTYGIKINGTKLTKAIHKLEEYGSYWGYEKGSLTWDGVISNDNTRLRLLSFIPVEGNKQYRINATPADSTKVLNISASFYTTADFTAVRTGNLDWSSVGDMTFVTPSNSKYIMVLIKFSTNASITPSDIATYTIEEITSDSIVEFCESVGVREAFLERGTFSETGLNANSTQRLRTINYIPVVGGQSYRVSVYPTNQAKKLKVSASFYNANDYATARIGYIEYVNIPAIITIPSGASYMRFLVAFDNDATITKEDISGCLVESIYANGLSEYVVNDNLQKQSVRTSYLGTLTYVHAFCKYNGKYYSTDGEHIGVQSSDFTSESTASVDVGHGNALQLGNGGVAFASGWDDQTIYAVDLSDVSIEETITLPTTGYTTCAVDDVNKIAYIFQRDTYPDTEEHYNFIVYDYDNEQIISTKKLTNAFGGMQACDFYNGKIAVIYGFGTASVPSGMCIYNTNGDILAEYYLDIFASTEPEGICFDRDTHELIISLVNKKAYKVYNL